MNLGKIASQLASNRQGERSPHAWTRIVRLAIFLSALALLSLGGAALAQDRVDVPLTAVGNSGVSGDATLIGAGEATQVTLNVTGLAANAEARATMHAGTCETPGASFAALPNLAADASGNASATGAVLFQGSEDVALQTMADGEHIISISSGDQVVACGVIPNWAAVQGPSQLPTTGGAGFPLLAAITGLVGFAILTAGLLLKQRSRRTLS
jgi:hypothetical protein